jgi:glyoxylase-like metal-dependent hydrolase (beta-lactamase superfamily II)
VVHDEASKVGVAIDPVLDYDPKSGRTSESTLEPVCRYIEEQGLKIPYVLDTHAHADHMTALPCFKERYGAKSIIGSQIVKVQQMFGELYNLGPDFATDGSQYDVLLGDDEELDVGPFSIKAHHSPGHTPACSVWHIADKIFVGDVLFMPDHGTARCDFPGGSASDLYDSVRRLYELPGETEVFTCHDYQPGGRELRFRSTIEEQRTQNKQLTLQTTREQFIQFREERDATLDLPTLMVAVLQVNIRAGQFPPPEANGTSYLKIPLNKI